MTGTPRRGPRRGRPSPLPAVLLLPVLAACAPAGDRGAPGTPPCELVSVAFSCEEGVPRWWGIPLCAAPAASVLRGAVRADGCACLRGVLGKSPGPREDGGIVPVEAGERVYLWVGYTGEPAGGGGRVRVTVSLKDPVPLSAVLDANVDFAARHRPVLGRRTLEVPEGSLRAIPLRLADGPHGRLGSVLRDGQPCLAAVERRALGAATGEVEIAILPLAPWRRIQALDVLLRSGPRGLAPADSVRVLGIPAFSCRRIRAGPSAGAELLAVESMVDEDEAVEVVGSHAGRACWEERLVLPGRATAFWRRPEGVRLDSVVLRGVRTGHRRGVALSP